MTQATATEGRGKIPPELVLVSITMIWGFTFLAIKLGLAHGGALALVGLRFAIGAVLLVVITRPSWPRLAEWRAGFFIGASLFAGYALQAQGLTDIASSRSAFFTALYVPLVPVLQLLLFRKPPGWSGLLAIILAFAGLALLAHPKGGVFRLSLGDMLTLAAALACALEIILLSRYAPRCNPQRLAVVQMSVVAVLSLGANLLTGAAVPWGYPPFWYSTIGLGAATSVIMFGQAWGQAHVPALRASVIFAMEPVWAGAVGAVAGDPMGLATIAGAGMIVTGILAEPFRRFLARKAAPRASARAERQTSGGTPG